MQNLSFKSGALIAALFAFTAAHAQVTGVVGGGSGGGGEVINGDNISLTGGTVNDTNITGNGTINTTGDIQTTGNVTAGATTIDGATGVISGVAAGAAGTDAVNVNQLNAANARFDSAAARLDSRIDKIDKKLSLGIASTAAMANIPQVESGKRIAVGVGIGNYNSESAVALGASIRISRNGVSRISMSSGSGGKPVFGAGASWSW